MDDNLKREFMVFVRDFESRLKTNARVRTGLLKRSIDVKVLDNTFRVKFVHYGIYLVPWFNKENPIQTLRRVLMEKRYSKQLADAFGEDFKLTLIRSTKSVK